MSEATGSGRPVKGAKRPIDRDGTNEIVGDDQNGPPNETATFRAPVQWVDWKPEETSLRTTFISDLHLFSNRSSAVRWHDRMEASVAGSDLCIWGGDLFDFRWATVPDRSVDAAFDFLNRFADRHPRVRFLYLSGNHDAHHEFRDRMPCFIEGLPNFVGYGDAFRFGQTLWLHGDVIEGGRKHDGFLRYRRSWGDKPPAKPWMSGVYDAAVATRLHRAVAAAGHPQRFTCRKLHRWVRRQPKLNDIRRVVFGHTHRLIRGTRYRDLRFYNGGAAIRHVAFEPIELTVSRPSPGTAPSAGSL